MSIALPVLGLCAAAAVVEGLFTAALTQPARDARWTGHARYHTVVYGITRIGVAALCVALVAMSSVTGSPASVGPAIALLLAMDGVTLFAQVVPGVAEEPPPFGRVDLAVMRLAAVVAAAGWTVWEVAP